MKTFLLLVILFLFFPLSESQMDRSDINLVDFKWKNRLVLVFSESPGNVLFQQQIEGLSINKSGLTEREVLVLSLFISGESNIDGKPISVESAQRIASKYNSEQNGFRFILIGKDGGVKMDTDDLVTIDTLFGRIDSMPMRIREMRMQ